jgi:hypothetical protein
MDSQPNTDGVVGTKTIVPCPNVTGPSTVEPVLPEQGINIEPASEIVVESIPVTGNVVDLSIPNIGNIATPSLKKKGKLRKSPRTPSQALLSGKRNRIPVELFSPDSTASIRSTPQKKVPSAKKIKQTPNSIMHQLEDEYLKLKAKVVETPLDEDLCAKANKAERDFYKAVLKLGIHSNNRTKWKGWELGYAKLVCLSEVGLEYAKTPRK